MRYRTLDTHGDELCIPGHLAAKIAAIPLPILYSFRRCPYAMRARAALIAGGIRVELREVELRDKPAAMLAASPKGSVPVLVLPFVDTVFHVKRFSHNRTGMAVEF